MTTNHFAIVLAGGGERLVAWHTGVLAGMLDAGRDPRAARAIIGTSAGAYVAARLAYGIDPRDDAARIVPRSPGHHDAAAALERLTLLWSARSGSDEERRRRLGELAIRHAAGDPDHLVAALRSRLPNGPWPAALRIAAVDADTGARVELTAASGVSVPRAVAASRAIPTLHPPVPAGGRRCIDGAVGSATNADLAADAPTVVVIAGVGERPQPGTPDSLWAAALDREVEELLAAGRRVFVLRPSESDQAAMGPDPMSGACAVHAAAAGREAGLRLAAPSRAAA